MRIKIRGLRDSLGVPMEPDYIEPEVIYDIYGDQIRSYEYAYDTLSGWVHEDNIEKYILEDSTEVTGKDVEYFDGEKAYADDYDTLEYDGEYYTLCTIDDFIKYLDFGQTKGEDM